MVGLHETQDFWREKMVGAKDVLIICRLLSNIGIDIWITGGWGIDALLERQTREHKDLDVIMLLDDVIPTRELMSKQGYELKELWSENLFTKDTRGNETATAFVLRDAHGREFDAHAIRIDEQGNGIPAWDETDAFILKKEHLVGIGAIAGFPIRCITPESQMMCHTGYELPKYQWRDLVLLQEKFGVGYPEGFTRRNEE